MDFPVKEGDVEDIAPEDMPLTFMLALQNDTMVAFFEGPCEEPGVPIAKTFDACLLYTSPSPRDS